MEVTPLEFPELGEETFAWRANVTIDLEGLEVPIFQDLVVVFDGEAVSRLMFLNPGSEFPQSFSARWCRPSSTGPADDRLVPRLAISAARSSWVATSNSGSERKGPLHDQHP